MNRWTSSPTTARSRGRWKKAVALAAALAVTTSAGAAWAQTQQETGSDPIAVPGGVKLLGDGTPNAVFTPLTPCRVVDTRIAAAGALPANTARDFKVRGNGGAFVTQGGNNGGCQVPTSAVAVEVTITAVDAGRGYLRAWPSGGPVPTATFLNFTELLNVSNTGTIDICDTGCAVNKDLQIKAFQASTDVVVDVQGFYASPPAAVFSAAGSVIRGNRVVTSTHPGTGQYTVTFDRTIASCAIVATIGRPNQGDAVASGFASVNVTGNSTTNILTYGTSGDLSDRAFHLVVLC